MKAMILAAGLGERLRPLTNHIPKALVCVRQKPLIIYHIENLKKAGFHDIIINISYLGEQIRALLGNGETWGMNITYSEEASPLETGGGIVQALPLLGDAPFITINADIFTDFDFSLLRNLQPSDAILAHLILIPPSLFHQGDFYLNAETKLIQKPHDNNSNNNQPRYIASGITWYRPEFFTAQQPGKYSVAPLWRKYACQNKISGMIFHGQWHDVGSLEKLRVCEASL